MAEQLEPEQPERKATEGGISSKSDLWVGRVFGLISGYFILSGSIATFIYLRWIGIAPIIADAVEPLPGAATGVLGVVAVFVNAVLMGMILVNGETILSVLRRMDADKSE